MRATAISGAQLIHETPSHTQREKFLQTGDRCAGNIPHMATARHLTPQPGQFGHYHCSARVVQQMFLRGYDETTGKNYNHRRDWSGGCGETCRIQPNPPDLEGRLRAVADWQRDESVSGVLNLNSASTTSDHLP